MCEGKDSGPKIPYTTTILLLLAASLLCQGQSCGVNSTPIPASGSDSTQPGTEPTPGADNSQVLGYKPATPLSTAAATPSEVRAEALDDGTIRLTWTDNSADESGFLIRRYDTSAVWSDYAETGPDVTTFIDTAVEPRKTYCYRIVARNSAFALSSVQQCVRAVAPTAAGDVQTGGSATETTETVNSPSNLLVAAVAPGSLDLSWTDLSDNEEGFVVRRYNGRAGWEEVGRVGPGVTQFQDRTIQPSVAYCYQVAAFLGQARSAYSASRCAIAPASTGDLPETVPDSTPVIEIAGMVTANGQPLAGVSLSVSNPATVLTTSADGSYTLAVPAGWTGTIQPSLEGHTFYPARNSYQNVLLNLSGENFTATPIPPAAVREMYYIAPDGRQENDGTFDRPWPDVQYALKMVGGGKTLVLKPGEYQGPITIAPQYSGTASSPTVITAYRKWTAIITGGRYVSEEHLGVGVYLATYGVSRASWVVLEGLQVCYNEGDGIMVQGDNNVVRGCWIHHNGYTSRTDRLGRSGIGSYGFRNNVFEDNLLEHNGRSSIPQNGLDHGLYAFGTRLMIRNNIVRNNVGYGICLYGSSIRGANDSEVSGNLCYGQVNGSGIYVDYGPGGQHVEQTLSNPLLPPNRIYGNTCWGNGVDGITVLGENSASPQQVMNNISVGNKGYALSVMRDQAPSVNVVFDYNFVSATRPKGVWYTDTPNSWGQHNIADDEWPFLNQQYGLLLARSRALAAGDSRFRPGRDLFGRARSDAPVDVGAMPFGDYSSLPWAVWTE